MYSLFNLIVKAKLFSVNCVSGFCRTFVRYVLKRPFPPSSGGPIGTAGDFQVLQGLFGTFTDFSVSSMLACFTAESPKFHKFSLLAGTQVDFWGLDGFAVLSRCLVFPLSLVRFAGFTVNWLSPCVEFNIATPLVKEVSNQPFRP